jgi:hypothetical protein
MNIDQGYFPHSHPNFVSKILSLAIDNNTFEDTLGVDLLLIS